MDTPLPPTANEAPKTFDLSVKEAAQALGKYDKFIVRLIKKGKLPYQEITNERNLKEYRLNLDDVNLLKGQVVGQYPSPTPATKDAENGTNEQQISLGSLTKKKSRSDLSDTGLVKYLKDKLAELEKGQSDNPLVDRLKLENEDLKDRLKSKEDTITRYVEDQQQMAGKIGYFSGQADVLREEVRLLREGSSPDENEKSEGMVEHEIKKTDSPTEVRQSPTNFFRRIFSANTSSK